MKIIQVGLGGMGNAWLNAAKNVPDIEYAALVEINDVIAAAQAERYGLDTGKIFHTIDEALRQTTADGVIDVTPPQFHRTISTAALNAGVPVLSEKPLANTLEDARAIVELANATGVLHMVAQNRRYSVPSRTLKGVLDNAGMGRIASVQVEFYKGPHFGGFRDEMDYPLIIDMAIHHFDMMRYFLDADATSIFGRSWNPSWSWYKGDSSAALIMEFSNDSVVTYHSSWSSTGIDTSWNAHWRFECENGVVVMRDDRVSIQRRTNEIVNVNGLNQFRNDAIEQIPPATLEFTDQAFLLNVFRDAVENGTTPMTICQDNIKSLEIVFNAIGSFESGGEVKL